MAGASGTAVELYDSIDEATSLIVTGNSGVDDATVSFAAGAYTVQGAPGANPVLLGDPSSGGCSRDPDTNAVSCQGPISSIQASLGAGNDTFTVDSSVPASVSATIDGGPGSTPLGGGEGDDTLYAGDDHVPTRSKAAAETTSSMGSTSSTRARTAARRGCPAAPATIS